MDHVTIIASIGLSLAIIGLILTINNLKKHRKETKLTIQRIKNRRHFPQTIHEVMAAQWPGELQKVSVEYKDGSEDEFIARSDENGFFITDTQLNENDEITHYNYRTIEQLSDAQITKVEIDLYYEINVEEEMSRINDSR